MQHLQTSNIVIGTGVSGEQRLSTMVLNRFLSSFSWSHAPRHHSLSMTMDLLYEEKEESRVEQEVIKVISNEHLNHIFWKLTNSGPVFPVRADSINFLYEPVDFFNTLKSKLLSAKNRIVFSSLYLGAEPECKEMVSLMRAVCKANSKLKIVILQDYLRGIRGIKRSQDSLTMLFPLSKEFPDQITLYFFHTPLLSGVWKALMPERLAEVSGVQHIKAYIFDNDVIISGANLSTSYFTNRQDRYVVITGEQKLSDYFANLIYSIGLFSYKPNQEGVLELAPGVDSPFVHPDRFQEFAAIQIKPLTLPNVKSLADIKASDTWVFPLLQMDIFGIQQDEEATTHFLSTTTEESELHVTSPYFNLTPHYINVLLNNKGKVNIITAAPEANGFFTASGLAGKIPAAYTYVEKQFYETVKASKQTDRIHLYEWLKKGWTYHGKGFWYSSHVGAAPSMTAIGSSNLGVRSAKRDLEAQIFIFTENKQFQQKLEAEKQHFFNNDHLTIVEDKILSHPQRAVPMWIRLCSDIIRAFL